MNTIIIIALLLLVLGILIFVHELGHYLAARWAKMRVNVFSIGFGRAILKWRDKRGTVWKIGMIPIGGYVQIYGQSDMFDRKAYKALPPLEKVGHYLSAPAWKQFIVIAAGAFMNFVLAWAIYSFMFAAQPRNIQLPVIGQVIQESPAFIAGIQPGDTILRIDGKNVRNWGE